MNHLTPSLPGLSIRETSTGLIYHVGVSGGKDSTALLLWILFESGIPRHLIRVTFCDTGNEDELTYAHLRLIHRVLLAPLGIALETLMPERDFFALALWKKRFPARVAQFCTIDLKIEPTRVWLRERWAEGFETVLLNGKRVGESAERARTMADQPERGFSDYWGCEEWMPLRSWTLDDVFAIHRKYDFPLNPLYALGASRVGCWPCINCGKREIRLVAKHRPEKIALIAAVEQRFKTELGRTSTFFHGRTAPKQFRTESYTDCEGREWPTAPIAQIVKWAHTKRGGKEPLTEADAPTACFSKYHACE
jgi:3'-phosphoadenosine 5'-phosphosulfate sulfotransferase (PAPS reductase)/FAD synthetase